MLYIRTDMNEQIATGHVMRCLAIADAARESGDETLFIVSDRQAAALLEKRGYAYFVLNTKWNDMESELPVMEKLIKEKHIKRMLIDSYQVTYNYLKQMTSMTETVFMDDLNAFLYPVDAIICCSNCWEKFQYEQRYKETELYLGPQYAPLRKEFCNCMKKYVKTEAENLLLMSGGSDPYQILSEILAKMKKNLWKRIDVICGIYNDNYDMLKTKYQSCKNVYIHKAVDDIHNYMAQADLSVSAGGTTLYELCTFGTPTISYAIADNQLESVEKFQEDGIIDYAGDVRKKDVVQDILQWILEYQRNVELRMEKSKKMQKLIDGRGAERIASILKISGK